MADRKDAPEVTVESLQVLVGELNLKLEAEGLKAVEVEGKLVIVSDELELTKEKLAELVEKFDRENADHESTKGNLANALNALTEATEFIEGQRVTIAEQDAKILSLQISPAAFPTITVNKKTYEVHVKSFQYKKEEYTVAQLLKDKALQKELVEKGVGFLVLTEA